jgi:hypothetical protein
MHHARVRELVRRLRRLSYTVSLTRKGHLRVSRPDLEGPVFTSGTPSDANAACGMVGSGFYA